MPKRKVVSGWASLCEDLLNLILNRLEPCDYVRLRAVCKSWYLIALRHHKENRIRLSNHQPPWLLTKRKLFNYVTGAEILCKFSTPYKYYTGMRPCGCCHGWLIFFMSSSQLEVLDPFSGVVIQLPPFNNRFFKYVDKVILSTDPSLEYKFEVVATCWYSDVVAHLVYGQHKLQWTYSERTRGYYTYNFAFYKDRILGVSEEGRIVSLNVINSSSNDSSSLFTKTKRRITKKEDSSSPPRICIEEISSEILQCTRNSDTFFVETTNDELLMVGRSRMNKNKRYNIYKIINSNGQLDLSPVVDLGGHSLFLGKHNSISVMASNYPGLCRPNSIYYVGSQNLQYCGVFEEFKEQSFHVYEDRIAMYEGSWIVPSMKLP